MQNSVIPTATGRESTITLSVNEDSTSVPFTQFSVECLSTN